MPWLTSQLIFLFSAICEGFAATDQHAFIWEVVDLSILKLFNCKLFWQQWLIRHLTLSLYFSLVTGQPVTEWIGKAELVYDLCEIEKLEWILPLWLTGRTFAACQPAIQYRVKNWCPADKMSSMTDCIGEKNVSWPMRNLWSSRCAWTSWLTF